MKQQRRGWGVALGAAVVSAGVVGASWSPGDPAGGPAHARAATAASSITAAAPSRTFASSVVVRPGAPAILENATEALKVLESNAGSPLTVSVSRRTGHPEFIRAPRGELLAPDGAGPAPERALRFLGHYGSVLGMSAAEQAAALRGVPASEGSSFRLVREETDDLGETHVRLAQEYRGLPVLGGQLVVHLDERGVTGVNGQFVAGIALDTTPALTLTDAQQRAVADARRRNGGASFDAEETSLGIYRRGLLEGFSGESVLAYGVRVRRGTDAEQIWLDAVSGTVLNRIPLHHSALDRIIYSPQYLPDNPELFVQRREGEAASLIPMVNSLYDFAGQTYNLYASAFGRDSFDGAGKRMISVYLVDQNCPNAYWNSVSTNYCPGFDLDDVVSHEWSHAYTEYTHGLIYSYQSGALNESYSDIFGEAVDLLNGVDGLGGANNAEPAPNGQRWVIGEDLTDPVVTLLFRDMWDPERLGYPASVTSANYACGTGDGGGVHTNSSVSNHAFAMLVDGKTFNGQTIRGIGLTKAAAIYFRAASVYQTPSSNFVDHANAVEASCQDLTGQPLSNLSTLSAATTASTEVIDADDCEQVKRAMLAVEMRTSPAQCNFQPQLAPNPPAACAGGTALFAEDWETGLDGWTLESVGVTADWPNFNWTVATGLPEGRAGASALAPNSRGGTCTPGGDHSGRFALTSPVLSATSNSTELRFNHFVETEMLYDGGNLRLSVNGGAFSLIPLSAYTFNGPVRTLDAAAPVGQNTNPKAGESAWTGADDGDTRGSWGTTVLNLGALVRPGDSFQVQFDFGNDGCNGVTGWFVDEVQALACPASGTAPSASFTGPSSTTLLQQVSFDASGSRDNDSNGPGIVGYAWDFGDGLTGSGAQVNHRYLLAGTYVVALTVTDDEGETARTQRSIVVRNPTLPLADLGVSSVTAGAEKSVTNLTAVIVNRGKLATLPSSTRFDVDGVTLATVSTPSIPAGGSAVVSTPWNFEALKGAHEVTVKADARGLNVELAEDNNTLGRTFRVTGNRLK